MHGKQNRTTPDQGINWLADGLACYFGNDFHTAKKSSISSIGMANG